MKTRYFERNETYWSWDTQLTVGEGVTIFESSFTNLLLKLNRNNSEHTVSVYTV